MDDNNNPMKLPNKVTVFEWNEREAPGCLEIVPVDIDGQAVKSHYTGDECWCKPLYVSAHCRGCHNNYPIFVHRHLLVTNHAGDMQFTAENGYKAFLDGYDKTIIGVSLQAQLAVAGGHHG